MAQLSLQVAATVEIEDLDELSDEDTQALEEDIHQILDDAGAQMEEFARGIVPVRTGNLMASIFHDVDDDALSVTLGATADYASFVEYGTYKMKPQPFLEPAAETGQEEMNLRIEQAVLDRVDGKLQSPEDGDNVTMEIEGVTESDVEA
jgi:HK97 gp10 family phage protein